MSKPKIDKPIVNAHAHIFTHKHVPPYLGKKILPWPLYYLVHIPFLLWLYVKIGNYDARKFKTSYRRKEIALNKFKRFVFSNIILRIIYHLVLVWIALSVFYIAFDLLIEYNQKDQIEFVKQLGAFEKWCVEHYILFDKPAWLPYPVVLLCLALSILYLKFVRSFLSFVFKKIWSLFNLLPGKKTKALYGRYLMMARFAAFKRQKDVFLKLKRQYPIGSQFIVLPMDMKYMGAGRIKKDSDYYTQMKDLIPLSKKDEVHPFVFIDPRRIREDGKAFFDYENKNGRIILKDCFVKEYIETHNFSGFKIYPALGYFPFDADLLPLWLYAVQNNIPIMTHGIKGIIYYRGDVTKLSSSHPVFKEFVGNKNYEPLYFDALKNHSYQTNFTHPLNYLCLLEEPLLRELLQKKGYEHLQEMFGYTSPSKVLKNDLGNLKICFAHFGGTEEWNKYLERDRDNYAQQLVSKPGTGIHFSEDMEKDGIKWGRYENLWKNTDWYSICCAMMIQYPNFYTDISYIVSNTDLYPLLRSTLSGSKSLENVFQDDRIYESRDKLRTRVLFGSDFYVVRSQRSDKDIFTEIKAYLTEYEFNLIARENPATYLAKKEDNL